MNSKSTCHPSLFLVIAFRGSNTTLYDKKDSFSNLKLRKHHLFVVWGDRPNALLAYAVRYGYNLTL